MPKNYSRGMWQKVFLAGESMHFSLCFYFLHLLNICFRAESTHIHTQSISNLIIFSVLPFAYKVFFFFSHLYSMLLIKVFRSDNILLNLLSLRANKIMGPSNLKMFPSSAFAPPNSQFGE